MNRREAIETLKKAIAQVEWDYPMEIAAALDFAIADMKICEANNAGWISVKDRLPEQQDEYLIITRSIVTIGWFSGIDRWVANDGSFYADGYVTHWMSLPEPPKEGFDDGTDA